MASGQLQCEFCGESHDPPEIEKVAVGRAKLDAGPCCADFGRRLTEQEHPMDLSHKYAV